MLKTDSARLRHPAASHNFSGDLVASAVKLTDAPSPDRCSHPSGETDGFMKALFIGQTYIDVTFITDHMPTGDEKHVASDYAVSFGGNAVTAAFCCAKLGIVPDLIATVANDWLGRMFMDMCGEIRHRDPSAQSGDVRRCPSSCRRTASVPSCAAVTTSTFIPSRMLNLEGCRALHVDGHQPDAAIHYAKLCREAGILTSLDGGGLRTNTHELLEFIDVAIVAERLCEQMDLTPETMLDYLKSRGCRVGGVTHGREGPALVRRDRRSPHTARAADPEREGDRYQRRRRRVSTALTSIRISPIPAKAGTSISSLRGPHRPSRSSASATKPGLPTLAGYRRRVA